MVIVCVGWGMCQVSLAFLASIFFGRTQSASMIGYTFSIFGSAVTSTLILTNGCYEYDPLTNSWTLKPFLHYLPNFCFNRVIFQMVDTCMYSDYIYDGCISSLDEVTQETWGYIYSLYFDAILYMVLAIYLNEVVPQTYGIPKHPLFFMETFV